MADSENSTTLSSVTRRRVLASTIATAIPPLRMTASESLAPADPIVSVWREWLSAHHAALAWGRKAASLEHAMVRTIGFPTVLISPPCERPVYATSYDDIDAKLGETAATEEHRQRLHSDFSAQQARWDAAADATGMNAADRKEVEAWKKSEELAETLFALRSQSVLGVIIKLALVLQTGEAQASADEHPWPQIRSAYDDLRCLTGVDDLTA